MIVRRCSWKQCTWGSLQFLLCEMTLNSEVRCWSSAPYHMVITSTDSTYAARFSANHKVVENYWEGNLISFPKLGGYNSFHETCKKVVNTWMPYGSLMSGFLLLPASLNKWTMLYNRSIHPFKSIVGQRPKLIQVKVVFPLQVLFLLQQTQYSRSSKHFRSSQSVRRNCKISILLVVGRLLLCRTLLATSKASTSAVRRTKAFLVPSGLSKHLMCEHF